MIHMTFCAILKPFPAPEITVQFVGNICHLGKYGERFLKAWCSFWGCYFGFWVFLFVCLGFLVWVSFVFFFMSFRNFLFSLKPSKANIVFSVML